MKTYIKTIVAAALSLASAFPAVAQEEGKPNFRERLALRGLTFEGGYVFDATWNVDGGIDNGLGYRGDFSLSLELDTEKAGWWKNGTFGMHLQLEHGNGVTEDYSGDFQLLSGLDADDFVQVSQVWYRHQFLENKLWIKGGKLDANEDFATTNYTADFSTGSAVLPPTIPMPTSPDQDLGVVLGIEPCEQFALVAGVFQGRPDGGRSLGRAFTSLRGPMILIEPRVSYKIKQHPGTLRIGYWWNGESYARLGEIEEEESGIDAFAARDLFRATLATGLGTTYREALTGFVSDQISARVYDHFFGKDAAKSHAEGIYATWDQEIYKEVRDDEEDGQGVGIFAQAAWTDGETQEVKRYFGGGLTWTGAIPSRNEDAIGLGVFHVNFSKEAGFDEKGETIAELYYRAQIKPWLALKPTMQYVRHPGGSSNDDAFAVGFRGEISF